MTPDPFTVTVRDLHGAVTYWRRCALTVLDPMTMEPIHDHPESEVSHV